MAATANYLAFDLGAASGRAVLGAFDGERLQLREIQRFPNTPVRIADRLHWDTLGLFRELKTALARCAAEQIQLAGIGLDTWGVDFALLAPGGELLGLPYHYRDARTRGMFAEAFRRVPREEIYARTGIQFMEINTLYQLLSMTTRCSPASGAATSPGGELDPHRTQRELLDAADTLLFTPDLLTYWLTGVRQSEHTIASTSQLYDTAGRAWAFDLVEKLGLPPRIFPPVVQPGTVVGPLAGGIREETGLPAVAVIASASHDTASAVAAVPAMTLPQPHPGREGGERGEAWAYISSGTWSLVGVELTAPLRTPAACEANFTNEGGVAGTVRFLKNVAGLWLVQECQRTWAAAGHEYTFDELSALAAAAPSGLAGAGSGAVIGTVPGTGKPQSRPGHATPRRAEGQACLIDPDDPRFLDPGDMPRRIQQHCAERGGRVPQTPGEIVRCCLESLALKYRQTIQQIELLSGRRIRVIHIVGGGVRNELLCQLTADATQRVVLAGPVEATAMGNILVQARAHGRVSSLADIRAIVRRSCELREYAPR